MESAANPVVVILGQTASGKSALAMQIAQRHDGEIVAADSRTIYTEMDIGTAKPTKADQAMVVHHGLDLIHVDQSFSAAAFQRYAKDVVRDCALRHKLPVVVGGSGLYIDGFVYNFSFQSVPSKSLRDELDALDLQGLQQRAIALGLQSTEYDFANQRHLSRASERSGQKGGRRAKKPDNFILIGLRVQKELLEQRITQRVGTMFEDGLIDEVQNLIKHYGSGAPGLLAPGYKAVVQHLQNQCTLDEAKEEFIRNDRRLAKRQQTWFKRNPDIVWCDSATEAEEKIGAFLSEFDTIHA